MTGWSVTNLENGNLMEKKSLKMNQRNTLQKLIDAAKYEFAKNGFTKTTVERITKKAGVAKGTFYLYFRTKEDVIKYMINEMHNSIISILDEFIEKLKKSEKNFKKLFKEVIMATLNEYFKLKDVLLTIVFTNYELSTKLTSFKEKNIEKIREYIKKILEICIQKGYIQKINIEVISTLLLTMFMHFSIEVLFKEGIDKLEYYVDIIEDFISNGLVNKEYRYA